MFQNPRKRAERRAFPITGYVGANGGGKSAAMVWDTLPSLAMGRRVLSTVRLLDWENPRPCDGCDEFGHDRPVYAPAEGPWQLGVGRPRAVVGWEVHRAAHPAYVKFTDWEQLLEAKDCDVLMDEVTGVASSRESQGMPAPVANKLVQLRRSDCIVRWSSPDWSRADVIIRRCSQAVVFAQGFMPKVSQDESRLWRERRMFRWQTFDAADFEEFTTGKREELRARVNDWHWGPKSPVFRAYDTYDSVSVIGTVSDTGRCYRCGGTRRAPKCSCPDDHGHEHGADESAGPTEWVRDVGAAPSPLLLGAPTR